MKPIIRRKHLFYGSCWWECSGHGADGCASTPGGALRAWFERTRKIAILKTFQTGKLHLSGVGTTALGLIEHDRYLLKVDSRQPGGKGNV